MLQTDSALKIQKYFDLMWSIVQYGRSVKLNVVFLGSVLHG